MVNVLLLLSVKMTQLVIQVLKVTVHMQIQVITVTAVLPMVILLTVLVT